MSKFLDRLEQITQGAPAPMGFGVTRPEKTPSMALLGLATGSDAKGIKLLAEVKPDGALISDTKDSQELKSITQPLQDQVPWGARIDALSEEDAKALEEGGSDLLAFSLAGTSVAAMGSQEVARILCVDVDMESDQLRAVDALPIDAVLVSMSQLTAPWTLENLATIARVIQRLDKYILVEVSRLPNAKELEAIRNTGVHGLAVNVGSTNAKNLKELKQAMLDLPRQRPKRRERVTALLPGSAFIPEPEPPEPDEDDDDE